MFEIARFLGATDCTFVHRTDATAAIGIIKRKGCGSLKHLTAKELWIQQALRTPGFSTEKVPRSTNPADMLCSPPTMASLSVHLRTLDCDSGTRVRGEGIEESD